MKSRKLNTMGFPIAKSTKFPRTIENPPTTGPKSIPASGLTASLKVRKPLAPMMAETGKSPRTA